MRLLISTGEVSGDLQGSLLIKALKDNAKNKKIKNFQGLWFAKFF